MELVEIIDVIVAIETFLFIDAVSQPIKEEWRHTDTFQHVDVKEKNEGLWKIRFFGFMQDTFD